MKFYDKIFFVAALLVLASSVAYMFANKPKIELKQAEAKKMLARTALGAEWKDVIVPELTFSSIEWPEIVAQDVDGKWFFQVFTPPKIWVDNDGKFITESPYIKEVEKQKFALKFKDVINEPYPIKFRGKMGDKKMPYITLYNEETKKSFMGKPDGKEIVIEATSNSKEQKTGISIKSFKDERTYSKNQTLAKTYTVLVLFDKALNREITIYSNKPTFLEERRTMIFILPNGAEWRVRNVGATMKVDKGTYKVLDIDFEGKAAIVELVPDDKKQDVQKMVVSSSGLIPVKAKNPIKLKKVKK